MTEPRSGLPPAGILGALAYLLIGWAVLLVPSLVRSIEASFGQSCSASRRRPPLRS